MEKHVRLLVAGYITANCNVFIPNDVIRLCMQFFNEELCWKLNQNDLKLINNNDYLESDDIIYNNDLSFSLKSSYQLIQAGNNNSKISGCILIRLYIKTMTDSIQHCTAFYTLQCNETESILTEYYRYSITDNMAQSIRLMISQLNNMNELTIRCNIHSLQIQYNENENDNKILYFPLKQRITFKKYISFTWKVSDKLLNKFKHCFCGSKFCGPIFDQICVVTSPNGAWDTFKGQFQYGVKLYQWPDKIDTMKIKCIMKSNEEAKEMIYYKYMKMNGNKASIYAMHNKFATADLKDELFFDVSIEILEMYDDDMQAIPMEKWMEFGVV